MPTLQFKGKNIIWNHHLSVPYHTLEEVEDLHFQPEKGNGNLIIEGDNLVALKALLPEYAGKVKCIYIDPPYNTGNEGWVYNDKVNSPLINNWLGKTVGTDDLTRHDKWLCMMTPRLKMLRDLLSDDGAIFISLDDNEIFHFKLLMDEIFGEENFISNTIRITTKRVKGDAQNINKIHDYLLIYSKTESYKTSHRINTENDIYNLEDEHLFSRGKYLLRPLDNGSISYSKSLDYEVKAPDGSVIVAGGDIEKRNQRLLNPNSKDWCFRWNEKKLKWGIENDFIVIKKNGDNRYRVYFKIYENVDNKLQPTKKFDNFLSVLDNLYNNQGTTEVKKLLENKNFDYPKPITLLKEIIFMSCDSDSIILDSFAGSGTTMHAVNELNKDGGNRKCILVQMKEDNANEPDKNNCKDITRERNKLAIEKLGYESGFKYLKVGTAIDLEKMLEGQLPTYEQFAKYIYYLGTGEHLAETQNINASTHFVGTHGAKAFYLIYEQDFDALCKMALNLSIAEEIVQHSPNKRRVIYAPACFLDSDYMEEKQIEFVSIPYNLFERQTN